MWTPPGACFQKAPTAPLDKAYYVQMHRLEDSHWWFVARRELACSALRRWCTVPRPVVLDMGCGTGGTLDRLVEFSEPTGVDLEPLALSLCRSRGHENLVLASATELPFEESSFDAALALDVLEHIPDHEAAAREMARVLRPGGVAVVTVPAYRFLWSGHDVALHHQRRYVRSEVRALLESAGLEVLWETYTVTSLFPAASLVRTWKRWTTPRSAEPVADTQPTRPWLNRLLTRVLLAEGRWTLRNPLPFGLTVLAVARKPIEPSAGA